MTLDEAKRHQNEIKRLAVQLNHAMANAGSIGLSVSMQAHDKRHNTGAVVCVITVDVLVQPDILEI